MDKVGPLTVAFSGAGGAGTVYILKKMTGHYRTVGMDMNPKAEGLAIADAAYTVPAATDSKYMGKLQEILEKENVGAYVPLIDEELLMMEELERRMPGLKIILPKHEFVRACLDKYLFCNAMKMKGLPCPDTLLLSDFEGQIGYPLIIKPRVGRGSRGFSRIENSEQLSAAMKNTQCISNYIVQRMIRGKEYTVSTVVSKKGEVLSVVPKEVIEKKGITKIGVTRRSACIEELCFAIAEKMGACGPFNVQLILEDGSPIPFEINPRFSTTVALTIESGVDEVDILIRDALGEKVEPNFKFRENLIMDRHREKMFMDEKEWLSAASGVQDAK